MSENHRDTNMFNLRRVERSPWTDPNFGEPSEADRILGEQQEWGWAIPGMYQALAEPLNHPPFPNVPSDNSHDVSLAYWTALLHLMIYSFGWVRPAKGLSWWYNAAKPVDDLRLRLMAEVWDADGQMEWFCSWLSGCSDLEAVTDLAALVGHQISMDQFQPVPTWSAEQRCRLDQTRVSGPHELHLMSHSSGPLHGTAASTSFTRSSKSIRRATLVTDSMAGWYRELVRHASGLPDLGSRSWHVEVVVRPVGLLGTFRRSRETGIWFSGQHRFHTKGC